MTADKQDIVLRVDGAGPDQGDPVNWISDCFIAGLQIQILSFNSSNNY